MSEAMSNTAEWRKLADDPFSGKHGSVSLTPVLDALRAACDRVDELESDQLDASQVGAQLMLRLGEHIEARQKAEARVAELESQRAAAQHASINDCERAEKAEARLKVAVEALDTYAQFARNGELTFVSGALAQGALAKLREGET